ncbi:MAG TPA: DUF177 domain-containing protein [Bacteroidia bacterium]|nr:DUF177 domain-containing protein [Bacteroidia bacterium]
MKDFIIPFAGLKDGSHEYRFEINRPFFEHFSFSEVKEGKLIANVVLVKRPQMLTFEIILDGEVTLPCDRCGNDYQQPVKGIHHLVVNTNGDAFNDEDDLVSIPSGEHEFDLAQYIYEYIMLGLPARRTCDNARNSTGCDPEVIAKLNELNVAKEEEKEIDPRWEALKNIKFKK